VYFYEMARRVGIDRIAAMANRFGLGVDLEIELPAPAAASCRRAPGARRRASLVDRRYHRARIGQGFYQLTPLSLAVMTARLAPAGRCSRI